MPVASYKVPMLWGPGACVCWGGGVIPLHHDGGVVTRVARCTVLRRKANAHVEMCLCLLGNLCKHYIVFISPCCSLVRVAGFATPEY